MTDAEFELYEQKLKEQQASINNAELQKHLILVPNQNENVAEENKVYMPTDISFKKKAISFEQAASDLYKYGVNNFRAHCNFYRYALVRIRLKL